jgi:hypothetical protein
MTRIQSCNDLRWRHWRLVPGTAIACKVIAVTSARKAAAFCPLARAATRAVFRLADRIPRRFFLAMVAE